MHVNMWLRAIVRWFFFNLLFKNGPYSNRVDLYVPICMSKFSINDISKTKLTYKLDTMLLRWSWLSFSFAALGWHVFTFLLWSFCIEDWTEVLAFCWDLLNDWGEEKLALSNRETTTSPISVSSSVWPLDSPQHAPWSNSMMTKIEV